MTDRIIGCVLVLVLAAGPALAQTPPSADEQSRYTGLLAAAARGDAAGITALVGQGARPAVRDSHGRTPLHVAAYRGHHDAMRALVEAGADPNALENDRYDIATIAAAHLGHADVVRILIQAGAPLDHVNNLGWTALIESIVLGAGGGRHVETLRALVEAGADVNQPDRRGQSPLALARARGYAAMVALLQQAGAR